ncbi:MAG: acyl-CoA dehydrogenase family protein [Armatimonadetes bacterium]|nr:acyl-CoA dehydrogenase family protein [Armatimonadota bacterium]
MKTLPAGFLAESNLVSPEHREFRARLRRFIAEEVDPIAARYEEEARFPRELVSRMGQAGLLGIPFPKEYGGQALDSLSTAMAVEEFSRAWGSLGIIVAAHIGLGSYPIAAFGNEEQKRKYLTPLARGERLGGYGLTEPQAGSDSGSTRTRTHFDGTHWVLNGTKAWCTNATEAYSYIVSAVSDSGAGKGGISAFIVERDFPGFSFGKKEDKMGLRASATGTLIFDDCLVPPENLLGEAGMGFKYFMNTLDGGRITIGAMALGLAQAALDQVVQVLHQEQGLLRDLWGSEYRLAPLAEMASDVAAARHMVYNAALQKDRLKRWTLDGAMAKYFASEVAMRVTSRAVEHLGTAGLPMNSMVSRAFRDAKLCTIGEGTNEIQRVVIAREILRGGSE